MKKFKAGDATIKIGGKVIGKMEDVTFGHTHRLDEEFKVEYVKIKMLKKFEDVKMLRTDAIDAALYAISTEFEISADEPPFQKNDFMEELAKL